MKKLFYALLCLLLVTSCSETKEDKPTTLEEPVIEENIIVPTFSIKIGDKEITDKDMTSYELVDFEVKLINSKGTEKNYKYTGYPITDVLDACGLNVTEGYVTAIATDGYETVYKDNIILDTTLIAVLRDGEAFEEGPWLAPCSSSTNGDYLKNVSEILIAVE